MRYRDAETRNEPAIRRWQGYSARPLLLVLLALVGATLGACASGVQMVGTFTTADGQPVPMPTGKGPILLHPGPMEGKVRGLKPGSGVAARGRIRLGPPAQPVEMRFLRQQYRDGELRFLIGAGAATLNVVARWEDKPGAVEQESRI